MARGGPRTGAGRKKGATSHKTRQRIAEVEKALGQGVTPLAYMLQIMNDVSADQQRRDDMARAAAPFVHPRLSSIDGDLNMNIRKHEEALDALE